MLKAVTYFKKYNKETHCVITIFHEIGTWDAKMKIYSLVVPSLMRAVKMILCFGAFDKELFSMPKNILSSENIFNLV